MGRRVTKKTRAVKGVKKAQGRIYVQKTDSLGRRYTIEKETGKRVRNELGDRETAERKRKKSTGKKPVAPKTPKAPKKAPKARKPRVSKTKSIPWNSGAFASESEELLVLRAEREQFEARMALEAEARHELETRLAIQEDELRASRNVKGQFGRMAAGSQAAGRFIPLGGDTKESREISRVLQVETLEERIQKYPKVAAAFEESRIRLNGLIEKYETKLKTQTPAEILEENELAGKTVFQVMLHMAVEGRLFHTDGSPMNSNDVCNMADALGMAPRIFYELNFSGHQIRGHDMIGDTVKTI